MELLRKVDVDARACCAIGSEVWAARQQGGVRILTLQGDTLEPNLRVPMNGDDTTQVSSLMAVFDEVWMSTVGGQLAFARADDRVVHPVALRLPGESQGAALTDMCFNGHVAAVASESGAVFVLHPLSKRVLHSLPTVAPCTAVAQFYSFIIGGDRKGDLYVWDALEGHLVVHHTRSKSAVSHVLHERSTGTIWVSRQNGNLDVYRLDAQGRDLSLVRRIAALGSITSLVEVTGRVVATTYERDVVLIDAASGEVQRQGSKSIHSSFVAAACKVVRQETAEVWTLGHADGACVWCVTGEPVSAHLPPFLHPREQAFLVSSTQDDVARERTEMGVLIQEARGAATGVQHDLRKALEEAQEMRLRVMKLEEALHTKEEQIIQRDKTISELEASQAKLNKEVTDIASKLATTERERTTLQGELSTAKEDASKARTEAATKQTEKLKVDQDASQLRTEKSNLEQRLRDAESRVADLQAENKRLCASIGDVTIAQKAEHDVQQRILQSSAKVSEELDQVRQLNTLMSAALASTVYTIRRKEEEERDLTALLNAFRRKVADRVSDPYLSALLLASMVRNPQRFDLDCDEYTKSQLMDRHGPFIRFLQQLQLTDGDAYNKLIQYLRSTDHAAVAPETRAILDQFVTLALRDGELNGDLITTLKRSIPNAVGTTADGGLSGLNLGPLSSTSASGTGPATTTTGTAPGGGVASQGALHSDATQKSGTSGNNTSVPGAGTGSGTQGAGESNGRTNDAVGSTGGTLTSGGTGTDFGAYLRALNAEKAEDDQVTASLLREIRSQRTIEENFGKEQQAMFEFVLKTRRTLVECLALLQRRTVSARQVVEALSLNTGSGAVTSVAANAAGTPTTSSASSKGALPLDKIFVGIMAELVELTTTIVSRFLTAAEKRRLNVS